MTCDESAEIISLTFNAPVVAAFTFLVLLASEKAPNFLGLVVITVTFGTIIPLGIIYFLSKHGVIPDFYASHRETRAVPFVGAISSYLAGAIVLFLAEAPPIVTALMLCYFGNSLVMMLVSLKWKISVHASGISGPATALVYALGVQALPVFVLLIPVGWARMKLKAHTLVQFLVGALLTIATTWIQLEIYLKL
jgi:membrane-associated phospholipid phosphatase